MVQLKQTFRHFLKRLVILHPVVVILSAVLEIQKHHTLKSLSLFSGKTTELFLTITPFVGSFLFVGLESVALCYFLNTFAVSSF